MKSKLPKNDAPPVTIKLVRFQIPKPNPKLEELLKKMKVKNRKRLKEKDKKLPNIKIRKRKLK